MNKLHNHVHTTHPLRRKTDIIGQNLTDPFFDSYEKEGLECSDILRIADNSDSVVVTVQFNKSFLKKLVRSHIWFIKEMEKFNWPQT